MSSSLEGPRLIEGIHGAPLALAVYPKVIRHIGVRSIPISDLQLILRMGHRNEKRARSSKKPSSAGNGDLRIEPERHHHVLAFVMEMPEVRKVTGVIHLDCEATACENRDQFLGA